MNHPKHKYLALLLSFFAITSGASAAPTLPFGATTMDQSAFAMGTMQWNVVFVQNDGSVATNAEYWSSSEISSIKSRISESESYWEGLTSNLNAACRLSINVNYVNNASPVTVPYEPTVDESEVWVNSAMGKIGAYTSLDRFANVRNFNQDTRLAAGTNWSTTLFILHNTTHDNTSYAYSYIGGPFAVLEQDSAGWGASNFNMVLSHEMGHVFFALDEYADSGAKTTDRSGYLNVANANASLDGSGNVIKPPQSNALMRNNGSSFLNIFTDGTYSPSASTRQAIGLRDTDGDSIPDILDTAPVVTGNIAGSNPSIGLFKFTGVIDVTAIPNQEPVNQGFSNSNNAMTIDTVTSAYYKLDGGVPVALSAADGVFDGYEEGISFTLAGLLQGSHAIDVYGLNNVGNQSDLLHFNFTVVPEPSSVAMVIVALISLLVYRRRK